jgi:hypothetical protein
MKQNLLIIVSVIIVIIMLSLSFNGIETSKNANSNIVINKHSYNHAFAIKPYGNEYKFNNNGVIFSGNKHYIITGNKYYPFNWNIYSFNKTLKHEKFEIINSKTIKNDIQNSAAEILRNKNIKVANIISFNNNTICNNIAIKNIKNKTESYIVSFNILFPLGSISRYINHNYKTLNNFVPMSFNHRYINTMQLNNVYNTLLFNNIILYYNSVLASSYIIKFNNYEELILNYKIELSKNETYTIDPDMEVYNSKSVGSFPVKSHSYIYKSNGNLVGLISQSVYNAANNEKASDYFGPNIASSFSPASTSYGTYVVNYEKQKVCWLRNTANSKYETYMKIEDNYFQNAEKKSTSKMEKVLNCVETIASELGYPIPGIAAFLKYYHEVTTKKITNGIETYANAGFMDYTTSPYFSEDVYCPLEENGHNSYIFGDLLDMEFEVDTGGTQHNPVINHFVYTTCMKITLYPSCNLYAGTSSADFSIGQYN